MVLVGFLSFLVGHAAVARRSTRGGGAGSLCRFLWWRRLKLDTSERLAEGGRMKIRDAIVLKQAQAFAFPLVDRKAKQLAPLWRTPSGRH